MWLTWKCIRQDSIYCERLGSLHIRGAQFIQLDLECAGSDRPTHRSKQIPVARIMPDYSDLVHRPEIYLPRELLHERKGWGREMVFHHCLCPRSTSHNHVENVAAERPLRKVQMIMFGKVAWGWPGSRMTDFWGYFILWLFQARRLPHSK